VKALLVVLALALSTSAAHVRPSDGKSPAQLGGLTPSQYDAAVKIVHEYARIGGAHLTSATAFTKPRKNGGGRANVSNTGQPCTSARVLVVTLIGSFRNVDHGGHPEPPGAPPQTYEPVSSMTIKADAATGMPCLVGVGTGPANPRPGAVRLPT
jgi:hypothetical protein